MYTNFIFPKPKDFDTFEDVVCSLYSRMCNNPNLQRYGRAGQKQNGIDVVGFKDKILLGIQCKSHPENDITTREIDEEIQKAEGFTPSIDELIICTSAHRDTETTAHVLSVNAARLQKGLFPISIRYWDDIYDDLAKYPDILHRHFLQYFPLEKLEHIQIPAQTLDKQTAMWPVSIDELKHVANTNVGQIAQCEKYSLKLGFSTFADVNADRQVDLDINLCDELAIGSDAVETTLKSVKNLLSDTFFSKHLEIQLQVRLSVAFQLGWQFRKVTGYELRVISRGQVWQTYDLPYVASGLLSGLPELRNSQSNEVVIILNISRDITSSVNEFVDGFKEQPLAVLQYGLDGHVIHNAAQALSLAKEISRTIKDIFDKWSVKRVHLFASMPASLSALVGYHLNAIGTIDVYYFDDTRSNYQLAFEISNSS